MATWPDGMGPIVQEIIEEVISGKQEYSDEHDLAHEPADWLAIIYDHLGRATKAAYGEGHRAPQPPTVSADMATYHHEVVVAAGVCIAALRADRKREQLKHGEHSVS